MTEFLTAQTSGTQLTISLRNDWRFDNVALLVDELESLEPGQAREITFRCGGLREFDLAGAWVLYDKSLDFEEQGYESRFEGFQAGHLKFLQNIIDVAAVNEYDPDFFNPPPRHRVRERLETVGAATNRGFEAVGHITRAIFDGVRRPTLLMVGETLRQIHETGVRAIPIVMVITFLMGIVLAYQASDQLAKFGVTIFVVDLVSNSVLREIGVLLAAVMVAGRSGSAFAAALGTMKLNEEIDALQVMGLNPNQILIAPRVLGLTLAMPFLTVFGDLAGLAGGAFICVTVLDIHWVQFYDRVASSVGMTDLWVGLIKAPFFALLIAATGTLRGMQVQGSAEELGRLTTLAVVQSIFLIIIADAFFTVLFSRMGI
ncbi:MlaE family ABC transporter permease [Elongatibacter sediminis]|uniref:ABC transporter permease n=1 Tax=Elongatibacter sediminis TaxID=3119006 RepID=A0AAW9RKB1_9GAMM